MKLSGENSQKSQKLFQKRAKNSQKIHFSLSTLIKKYQAAA